MIFKWLPLILFFLVMSLQMPNSPEPLPQSLDQSSQKFSKSRIEEIDEGDCTAVDFNAEPQSPLLKIPIYNQEESGICYSEAISQLVDYYRLKKGDRNYDLTNPIYAAWATYYKDRTWFKAKSLHGGADPFEGSEADVVSSIRRLGVCSDKDVMDRLRAYMKAGNMSPTELLYFLEMVREENKRWGRSESWPTTEKELVGHLGADPRLEQLRAYLQKEGLFTAAGTEVLAKTFAGCQTHMVNVPPLQSVHFGGDKAMQEAISAGLQRMPVDVGVCGGVFDDASIRGLRGLQFPIPRLMTVNQTKECNGMHAVLVTGQAKIHGSCHYLVRNSWGPYWYPKSATSCACITPYGKYKEFCQYGEGVRYLGCWFQRRDILPNTGEVNYFEGGSHE